MEQTFGFAVMWLELALVATFMGSRLKVPTALMEIAVGGTAAAISKRYLGPENLGSTQPWLVRVALVAVVIGSAVIATLIAGAVFFPNTF